MTALLQAYRYDLYSKLRNFLFPEWRWWKADWGTWKATSSTVIYLNTYLFIYLLIHLFIYFLHLLINPSFLINAIINNFTFGTDAVKFITDCLNINGNYIMWIYYKLNLVFFLFLPTICNQNPVCPWPLWSFQVVWQVTGHVDKAVMGTSWPPGI